MIKKFISTISKITRDVILRQIDNRYIISTTSAITFTGTGENCIYLRPNQQLPLYCLDIKKGGNIPSIIEYFENVSEAYSEEEESRLFCFYTKSKMIIDERDENFCNKVSLFIFSHNRQLLEEIANYYELRIMSSEEILKAILDIGLNTKYYNDIKSLNLLSFSFPENIETDQMAFTFKSIFAEGVYSAISKYPPTSRKFHIYQGVGHLGQMSPSKPDIPTVISSLWNGYLNITFDLSSKRTRTTIDLLKKSVSFSDPDKEVRDSFKMMLDEFDKNPSIYILCNIIFVTDNPKSLQKVSDNLNIRFIEKRIFAKDILYQTPILTRDGSFDFIMHTSYAKRYLQNFIRKSYIKTVRYPMCSGKDLASNYTTFSVFESPAPHTAVMAPTRSGKTYFVLSLISGVLRAKIELNENYIADSRSILDNSPVIVSSASRLGVDVDIVHFDVGYSGSKWITQLKTRYPKKVYINSDNLNDLRFGLTDIKTVEVNGKVVVDKADSLFLTKTISALLRLNNVDTLTAHESQVIVEGIAQLFKERNYDSVTIQKLRELGGYEEILSEIESHLGYELDDYTHLTDIVLPEKYSFLQVPRLHDLVVLLETTATSTRLSGAEKEIMTSAALKLKPLTEDKMFGYYNRVRIPETNYFYMELETLKKMGDNVLVPVYLMLFQQLYRIKIAEAQAMKNKNMTTKEVYFIMEELHNFTKIEELKDLIEAATVEAARYGIVFVFISQNASHFPESILLNLGNRVVMPAEPEERDAQLDQLPKFWKTEGKGSEELNEKGIDFFKRYAKRYNAVIKNSSGLFSFMPHSTKEKVWLFNSDAVATEI